MTENKDSSKTSRVVYLFGTIGAVAAMGFLILVGMLFAQSVMNSGSENSFLLNMSDTENSFLLGVQAIIKDVSLWFDGTFFQYNLLLLVITVSVPPLITGFYVVGMKDEKYRRLEQELPEEALSSESDRGKLKERVGKIFRFRHYMGSMSMLTIIVLMGSMIILFLKPLPLDGSGYGVDYQKGANFLMLGPSMNLFFQGDQTYLNNLITTLTAFQFGFLGAYVYFITHLVRSYFTLDLTPNTFVDSSVRMMMGSMLALVCSFLLLDQSQELIPILSFAIGFFPKRGLMLIEKVASSAFEVLGKKFTGKDYYATSLSELPGMSFAHELRLEREGYDNAENLSLANPQELAIRTGFSYPQLKRWISQADLLQYLRQDYKPFIDATGLSSTDEIGKFLESRDKTHGTQDAVDLLVNSTNAKIEKKIRIVCSVCTAPPDPQSPVLSPKASD